MDAESWPAQQLRPMLRIRLALVFLQIDAIHRADGGASARRTSSLLAGFDDRIFERVLGTELSESDDPMATADRLDALSEHLFETTQQLTLTDVERTAVSSFLDVIGTVRATGDLCELATFTSAERTEWAVMVTSFVLGVAEETGGPATLHPAVLDETLSAMYTWVTESKESPPGAMTDAEREQLRGVIADARERATVDEVRSISVETDLTGEPSDRRRDTDTWPDTDDFGAMVDPLAVRETAVEVATEADHSGPDRRNVRQIAALYDYVRDEIDYVSDPRRNYVAPPAETLSVGGGDCDCQAVLAASLFEAIGASSFLALIESERGTHHLLPLVDLGSPDQEDWITEQLRAFYDERSTPVENLSWIHADDALWFLADPVIGRYLGDRHRLVDAGFVHERSDGWDWHEAPTWYSSGADAWD